MIWIVVYIVVAIITGFIFLSDTVGTMDADLADGVFAILLGLLWPVSLPCFCTGKLVAWIYNKITDFLIKKGRA